MKIQVRQATPADVPQILELFCEGGENKYGWTSETWHHYYDNYPEGKPVSIIAMIDERVVGHYGLLPVRIESYSAMLGVHAYIAQKQRGLAVLSSLMKAAEDIARVHEKAIICGFANLRFSRVKEAIFKWKVVCWLGFKNPITMQDLAEAQSKKFSFRYSSSWMNWRFGEQRGAYLSRYVDAEGGVHKQLLKVADVKTPFDLDSTEGWCPSATFSKSSEAEFRQPFAVKLLDSRLETGEVYDFKNWSLEMGDSDTFRYVPWSGIR